jgi:RNA polymerase sigma-70 factor (ECF subfamily)|tara:strand:+ start:35376 stop:35915 length:540 start_codon:yes stop_codon:yes gene_type:complete
MDKQQQNALITAAKAGDAHAFERLINHYYDVIFKFACKWCGNANDAEDITQDSCIKLARFIGKYDGKSAFTSWLYRLVINCGKDWYKSQSRHPAPNPEALESVKTESRSEDSVYTNQVLNAVAKLPEGEKDAVILVLSEGLSHKEAAKVLGCKESTISWRVHEARKKLSAQFKEEQYYG